MFSDFQIKTAVSITLYGCLYSNSMICVDKPKESPKTLFICQFSQICCGILQLCRLCYIDRAIPYLNTLPRYTLS